MKEQLEQKITEVIEYILSKDAKDITYSEYKILDSKLSSIKYEEERAKNNQEISELMTKMLTKSIGSPATLPELKEE